MKKILIISGILALTVGLSACGKNEKSGTSSSSSKISSTSKSSSSSSSSSSASSSSESSSNNSMKTEEGSQTNLAQARAALYQAGVNTADVPDEQILQWWDEAKAQSKDFVEYAQSQMQ